MSQGKPATTDDTTEALKADITRLYQMNTDLVNEIERLRAALERIRDMEAFEFDQRAVAREALQQL